MTTCSEAMRNPSARAPLRVDIVDDNPSRVTLSGRVTLREFLVESQGLARDDGEFDTDEEEFETDDDDVVYVYGRLTPLEFFPSSGRVTPAGYVTPSPGYKTPVSGIGTPVYVYSPMSVRKVKGNDSPVKGERVGPEGDKELLEKENEIKRKLEAGEDLYPHCDVSIWLRSCTREVIEPMHGEVTGCIPNWLSGTLIRNGPGSLVVGDMTFEHLFDSSALLHRFSIHDGDVTYQNRFLQSDTFKRNQAAQRIVVTEFGTRAVPDPCQTIFQRVSALFHPGEGSSDNAMISVYPFGDEFYTFTESPVIHRIDPKTLDTLERVNVSEHVSIVNHTSHPHVMDDGTVFNLGLTITATGPSYAVVKFPPSTCETGGERVSSFSQAKIVGSVRARWRLNPSYMHTFGITENFFIIIEQPMSVSVPTLIKNQLKNEPLKSSLKWHPDKQTLIHVVSRSDGKLHRTFVAETFFFLHVINQYEECGHVVLDICCYRDPAMLDCMYIESLQTMQSNPDYARMFRGRPLRFVLPLAPPPPTTKPDTNLVSLPDTQATAYRLSRNKIIVKPELLCDLGCETPRINYEKNMGRKYRYFYAISSDVDLDNAGTLIKVDVQTKTRKTWCEDNMYPSEPIFVPSPNPKSEDDGVVLSALVWGQGQEKQAGLLILDAVSWTELGRAQFTTPSPTPKCLHGWFTSTLH